ncbi:MAG: CpsD/CapB family tyrosine-protein kinase [Syntrophorhabdales bacterium]|jgi:Mrp family chromosome partitioning ATPase
MSKIFDALEHARKAGMTAPDPPPSVSLPVNERGCEVDMEQEMLSLYQTITASLPDVYHPSVLLVGSRSNEGTSTVARQLAKVVSLRMEKKVLLIDLDRSRPDLHVYANFKTGRDGDGEGDFIEESMRQVEESSLFVMPLFQQTLVAPRTLDAVKGGVFWEPLKERFDLIIVDSPPATTYPDGPGIASQVDGVILVVEAEKTRWQVALSAKERIAKHGGNILGIVFNKRRYYIPPLIYRHL